MKPCVIIGKNSVVTSAKGGLRVCPKNGEINAIVLLHAPEGYFECQLHCGHIQVVPVIPCLHLKRQLDMQ